MLSEKSQQIIKTLEGRDHKAFHTTLGHVLRKDSNYADDYVQSYADIQTRITAFWVERSSEVVWKKAAENLT